MHLINQVPQNNMLFIIKQNIGRWEVQRTGPEAIKTSFMLNSAEHEIYPAHKC